MSGRLWTLKRTSQNETLPVIVRTGTSIASLDIAGTFGGVRRYNEITTLNPIDVVSDFPWTKSPKNSRGDVPGIRLTEKRLLMNSTVSNIANSVFAGVESGVNGLTPESVREAYQGAVNRAGSIINQGADYILKLAQSSQNGPAKSTAQVIGETIRSVGDVYGSYQLNNQVLRPYDFLYATENTGFQYIFPYFNNDYAQSSLSFGEDNKNIFSGISDIARMGAEGAAGLFGGLKPGIYIEKSKQYSMGDSGRSVAISFPLLNTGNVEDIALNWQLIYGLVYQNRPGRVTRSIIDMPVIYEVVLPGVVYMPFAYINSLTINFLGARRLMDINVPISDTSGGGTRISTIIPDAYQVNISLEGMNEETRNFLYTNVVNGPVTTAMPNLLANIKVNEPTTMGPPEQ